MVSVLKTVNLGLARYHAPVNVPGVAKKPRRIIE